MTRQATHVARALFLFPFSRGEPPVVLASTAEAREPPTHTATRALLLADTLDRGAPLGPRGHGAWAS